MDYIDFILDKFSALETVTAHRMFGGYVLHFSGKVLGFVFGDEFLFEPGPTVDDMLPDAVRKELFPGSKLFVLIDESASSRSLCELAVACYDDLPLPKPRKRRRTVAGDSGSNSDSDGGSGAGAMKSYINFPGVTACLSANSCVGSFSKPSGKAGITSASGEDKSDRTAVFPFATLFEKQ